MQPAQILKDHIAKTVVLNDGEFNALFERFQPQSYKKGHTIISAGDKVTGEYFVLSGCLKSFYITELT
jgi:CRP-like cAMP-binding protein